MQKSVGRVDAFEMFIVYLLKRECLVSTSRTRHRTPFLSTEACSRQGPCGNESRRLHVETRDFSGGDEAREGRESFNKPPAFSSVKRPIFFNDTSNVWEGGLFLKEFACFATATGIIDSLRICKLDRHGKEIWTARNAANTTDGADQGNIGASLQ